MNCSAFFLISYIMNTSFSILQKLKNQFLQTISNTNEYHFAFAPFAFSITNEDFYFLKDNLTTGQDAIKYMKELSEFSIIANSVSKKPNLWTIDGENLLSDLYSDTLSRAKLIDVDSVTADEKNKLKKAKKELYKSNGDDTVKFKKYKSFETKLNELDVKIMEHEALKMGIDTSDSLAVQKWELDKNLLNKQKSDLLIEWNVKGYKTTIENAKKVFEQIIFSKTEFIKKWQDAATSEVNTLTDSFGTDFKVTTCLPNSLCDYQSNIWKKSTIDKIEIASLSSEFEKSVLPEIIKEFGNVEILLDKIEFEYCFVDIVRPWFNEDLLKNQNWKYPSNTEFLSDGTENLKGNIPAYPVKIVLVKNIELKFSPNEKVNEFIKDKLMKGDKIFFGSMLLKNIPINLDKQNISSYKIHSISNTELNILSQNPVANPAKVNKMQLIQNLQNQDQFILKQKMCNQKSDLHLKTEISSVKLATAKPVFMNPIAPSRTFSPTILHSTLLIKPMVLTAQPVVVSTPTNFKIEGTIFDETNIKLMAVEIQIIDNKGTIQSVLTNENGYYVIDNIPNGSYTIKTKKAEYDNVEKTIQLNSNSIIDLALTKKPIPTETFQVLGIISKKLPLLPNPISDVNYI